MSCSYGPYEITSNLEAIGEFTFVDNELPRRVAISLDCAEAVTPPCVDAVALHIEEDCPDGCKTFWYECPSEMGRQYTVLPTPCGVKITSFEDGLITVGNCDATLFGSELFCFGKIYTNLGTFESPDKSLTTFEFNKHTFTVKGKLGTCNELYDCPDCQVSSQNVTAFEDLPIAPDDISAPQPSTDEELSSEIGGAPETVVIPSENRTQWSEWINNTTTIPFGTDTLCEAEKLLTSIGVCVSNDNPAIATLPSGHTVVAYENRREDGIAKITVAVLSSSVGENVRSYRKLGTGTLLNNLVETEGIAAFIVYEDMFIPVNASGPSSGEKIGFLTGPLAGSLFPITDITRVRDGDVIRHEFNFIASPETEFPDKNNIYDVNWFIVDNRGSADLPSSANVMTFLDLPHHLDGEGNEVPVSNPSIAVAQNNQMVSNEQNIYVVYQAFENDEWRVYLREIILGTDPTEEFPNGALPTYLAPYLFDENVRKIETMALSAPVVTTMGEVPAITFYNEFFTGAGLTVGQGIDTTNRWANLTDSHIPQWFWIDTEFEQDTAYLTMPLILCDGNGPFGATGLPATGCAGEGGSTCSAVFNSQACLDLGDDNSIFLLDHTRSFSVSTIPTTIIQAGRQPFDAVNLSFRMRFHVVLNNTPTTNNAIAEYPEIWFLIGRSDPLNVPFSAGYRIQIRRGKRLPADSMTTLNSTVIGGVNICPDSHATSDCFTGNCFIISLYQETSPKIFADGGQLWNDRTPSDGSQSDLPTRSRWICVRDDQIGLSGDYSLVDWNEWRVDTYIRGFYRFFDLYLTHSDGTEVLMTTFREWEESISPQFPSNFVYNLGPYHGFGFSQPYSGNPFARSKHQILIDSFSAKTIPSGAAEKIYFFEDWCNRDDTIDSSQNQNVVTGMSPFMVDEPILTNADYDGAELHYCSDEQGDQFYPILNIFPKTFDRNIKLANCGSQDNFPDKGWSSYLRFRPSAVDRTPSGGGVSHQNAVSMVISVNRMWKIHNGAYPHVWFVGRLFLNEGIGGEWFRRYRLRISRFDCVSDYASVGPGLSQGDKIWRISAYASGTGSSADIPETEHFLKIGTDTNLEWTEHAVTGGGPVVDFTSDFQSVWNYFKIDMRENDGQIVFDVYVGNDISPDVANIGVHPDDINFALLDSITVNSRIGVDGPFFGVALFSGNKDESAEGLIDSATGDGDDYRSSAHLNYIALSTIGAAEAPVTGACCRSVGGCDTDVLNEDCQSPNIWKGGQTCGEADCAVDLPVGAGCTSDGVCHDNITQSAAVEQNIGTCTNCEWQQATQCNPAFSAFRNCPPATDLGKCCRNFNNICVNNVSLAQCQDFFGTGNININGTGFTLGQNCNAGDCLSCTGFGACCGSHNCFVATEAFCNLVSATYQGDCTDCVSHSCSLEGACCDGDGDCTQEVEDDCRRAGSSFLGVGISCSPNPCAYPEIGACCFDDGICSDITESACADGTWLYDAQCSDFPCPVAVGGCCDPFTGECEDGVTAEDCQNSGRVFAGEGSICAYVDCDQPTGACCIGLNCVGVKTPQECTDLGGQYAGNFSNCIEGLCLGIDEDPYLDISINYKPNDLWVIETAPDQFVTRVLYHMQEEILVSTLQVAQQAGNANNTIDFMFLIDHSGSMQQEIRRVAEAAPQLAANMLAKGLDIRFGFTFFGRGSDINPSPSTSISCACPLPSTIADGLQSTGSCSSGVDDELEGRPTSTGGFTRNVEYLQRALNCWGIGSGSTSPWSAVQFVIEDFQFNWRPAAAKFVFFVTDTHPNESCTDCGSWSLDKIDAKNSLIDNGVVFVPVLKLNDPTVDNSEYEEVALASGWNVDPFDVGSENYGDIFEAVVNTIETILRIDNATVIERATGGTDATYLKKSEVIITYDGDLSDLWTFNKADFEFHDAHVPFPGTNTKQLVNFPFSLVSEKVYGIDSVHIQGNPDNWVSFGNEGALLYDHPNVGHRASGVSETPILISTNSVRPKVHVNNRNQVMVVYENYTAGTPQIEIKGIGDFHQNSIAGPKANRIVRLLNQNDFAYRHAITLFGEGANHLCDFVIDNSDITHVAWQSSRDGYWEIYYANSFNMFEPVRVTRAESRSSDPSIDVDETGSIFVVYHDDRFGPFNIMLSSKDEERVIPLLEQDAYLASLRTKYTHYTNTVPVFLDNPSGETPNLGRFWATKKADGAGNDLENFIYRIDEIAGIPSNGFDLVAAGQEAIAVSSTIVWGITSDGVLSRLGQIADDKEVAFNPIIIGTINLDVEDFSNHTILDMAVDQFDRIWVLIHETASGGPAFSLTPSGLPMIQTFAAGHRLRLEYVSGFNASTVASGIIKENVVNSNSGGSLAITSDNKFYVTWDNSPDVTLSFSDYPDILDESATFSFVDIDALSPSITPVSMTADALDDLFAVSSGNDLYTISKSTAGTALTTPLTTESGLGNESALPVGTTSGIAYQKLSVKATGEAQFFHIRIDFYDNITFEGDAFLSVDSRENFEAFINDETFDDPYAILGMDARGTFLELDQIGIVFFDATHFVPGFSRLSQPYSFEPNQTYFPRVFLIDASETVRESGLIQPNSFSCTKCSRFGNNNFNTNSCSYSFVVPNLEVTAQTFNFQIDFYADVGKQYLIRRFEASPGSGDLQYMEVDNNPAIDQWNEFGLPIAAGDSAFIQIHPVLDPTAGFLCGVTYTVQVNKCNSAGENCTNFSKISPSNWFSLLVGGGEAIDDQLEINNEVMLGLSMKMINNKLSIVWRTPDENLKFAQLDGDEWTTQVVTSEDRTIYCDLADINGFPSVSHIAQRNGDTVETVLTLEGGSWNPWPNMSFFQRDVLVNPRSLLEYDNAPMIAFVLTEAGQPTFLLNSGASATFSLEQSCFPPFSDAIGGSCTVALANINGLPAVAWIGAKKIQYAAWDASILSFPVTGQQIVTTEESIRGKIALVEVDGQPAIAYIKSVGSMGQLKYKRFDGTSWVDIPTNGQTRDFNNHIAMIVINKQPYIVYSIKTSSTTSHLRYAFHNGTKFVDDLIADDLNLVDHVVDIVEFNNEPAVIISANPFRVYFFRQQPSDSVNEIRPVFSCECASKIFTNRLTHLNEVARWESSAHGFSDTPITDSPKDSLRPEMRTRKTGAAIIIWEDQNKSNNCANPPCIRAATLRNANQDQLRGSGTKSWFDYDFGISGQDPDLTLDIFNRVNIVYEKPKLSDGLHGRGIDANELPSNELFGKVCDFTASAEDAPGSPSSPESCDFSALENNIVSFDKFVSSQIVRKIRVKDNFVQYYTYNAAGVLTPIVSTCNIALEIHGTPEIVALRFRNENKTVWGPWCPWSPQISDFVSEKEHRISGGSGIKEICIQAMTYIGVTTEFCLPIIADYETVVFETRFYKNTDSNGDLITNFSEVTNGSFPTDLDAKLIALPLSEGISVASLAPRGEGLKCSINSDCADDEICIGGRCLAKTATILVEIIPNQKFDGELINFDVIQQGMNDDRGRPANRGKNNEGRVLYRGDFTIEREDKVFNVDGLARISPTFPSLCEDSSSETVGASDIYTRDTFNEIGENITVEATGTIDPLAEFRQTISGRVGVNLNIRSSEDPYFVFGDPNYSLRKTDGRRSGVPSRSTEIEVQTGTASDQDGNADGGSGG